MVNIVAIAFVMVYQTTDALRNEKNWQQPSLAFSVNSILEKKQSLITHHDEKKLKIYFKNMSPLQIKDVVRQFGEAGSNLTTVTAQRQFIDCTGVTLIKQSVINNEDGVVIPQHYSCQKMSFKKTGPTIALASFPGSGNSWVRELLETATGVYTGSIYCDKSYIANGMIGEGVQTNNVLVIKTHGSKLQVKKAICIIRNPFDAIVADYSRRKAPASSRHTSELPLQYFRELLATELYLCNVYISCAYIAEQSMVAPVLMVLLLLTCKHTVEFHCQTTGQIITGHRSCAGHGSLFSRLIEQLG